MDSGSECMLVKQRKGPSSPVCVKEKPDCDVNQRRLEHMQVLDGWY